jgi:hypothetical protein
MTGYKKGRPVTQITEILLDERMYQEDEIRKALKAIPKPTKKRGKK